MQMHCGRRGTCANEEMKQSGLDRSVESKRDDQGEEAGEMGRARSRRVLLDFCVGNCDVVLQSCGQPQKCVE